jgi:sedoheptulokinase
VRVILSIDIGTSKIAAAAFDCLEKKNVAVSSVANTATLAGQAPGRHEQDPLAILRLCLALVGGLLESGAFSPREVEGLALSAQMHGLLLVDEDLEPLGKLITWCDQRAATLCSSIDRDAWPADRSGCFLHPGYGGATLAFLAAEGRLPAGALALSIGDFVAARLCGVAATEPSQAASWGLVDLRRLSWDEELLSALSIPRGVLPELKAGSSPLGTLRPGYGLPAGLPLASPLGDNQASYIGACGLDGRSLLLNLGTGGQISIPCDQYDFTPGLETRPLPSGSFLQVGSSLCGGRSYALLKDFFRTTALEFAGRELGDEELYAVMNRLADAAGEGPEVDTRFAGTRMDPAIRGGIRGIGTESLSPGSLCRGFALGMVRELADQVPAGRRGDFDRILASGNAARANPLVRRLISREFGLPCELASEKEEAATGAALVAARGLGLL